MSSTAAVAGTIHAARRARRQPAVRPSGRFAVKPIRTTNGRPYQTPVGTHRNHYKLTVTQRHAGDQPGSLGHPACQPRARSASLAARPAGVSSVDGALVISSGSDLRLPVEQARRHVPVGIVNPSRNYLAGDLRAAQPLAPGGTGG